MESPCLQEDKPIDAGIACLEPLSETIYCHPCFLVKCIWDREAFHVSEAEWCYVVADNEQSQF